MNKKYIYFYDRIDVLLDRYPAKIAQQLQKSDQDLGFVFVYSEKFSKPWQPNRLPKDSIVIYSPFLAEKTLLQLVEKYPPVTFVNIALRIPDIFMLGFFNQLKVPTYMVQHGLFVKHLTRVPFVKHFVTKFSQFLQYSIYSYRIAKLIKKPFIATLKDLYQCYIKGTKKFNELDTLQGTNLISTKVFAFDSSWDSYYANYGYNSSQMIYFGNPDYILANSILQEQEEDAICYICQTLVEDGRYQKNEYLAFLKGLKESLSDKKVYLKLHPRSDLSLYKPFESDNFIPTNDFKNCYTYIGHYSSLLEVANQLDRNVILFDLYNHPIPDNYKKYADAIVQNFEEANQYLKNHLRTKFAIKKEMKDFLDNNRKPYHTIAQKIIKGIHK